MSQSRQAARFLRWPGFGETKVPTDDLTEQQSSGESAGRRRLWAAFAWLLAALTLVSAWLPWRENSWSPAAILVLLLSLACEWLVLKRLYQHQHASGRRRNAVRLIMSVLLIASAIILAISAMRR